MKISFLLFFCSFVTVLPSARAQTLSTLYTFTGRADGAQPYAGLILDDAGNLYGTTAYGGSPNCLLGEGCGTVFKLDTTGKETVLHRFYFVHGAAFPWASLVSDAQGNLYSTTQGSETTSERGTVFRVNRFTNKFARLYPFKGGTDGANPQAPLVRDSAGNFYGVTTYGGGRNCGTVFKIDSTRKEVVLYIFAGGNDGEFPFGGLVRDRRSNLYGTTVFGGGASMPPCESLGCGTVFKLSKTGKETILHSFSGGADGGQPYSDLLRDAAGNLYGTAYLGGALACGTEGRGCGTVFRVDNSGTLTVLYVFNGSPDGANPSGGLIQDATGNLYGTTEQGGVFGFGTVFKLDTAGNETVLYSFTGAADGSFPASRLVQDMTGNLYGTTFLGGASCNLGTCGTVFKLTP
jgi:uncharacterized repeat protein (TIGR03803 family)